MRTNQEIRQEASAMLKGNWSVAVLVALVFGVIASFTSCSFPLVLFVYAPMSLGFVKMMLGYVRGTQRMEVEGIFAAFNSTYYWKSMGLYLLQGIYTFFGHYSLLSQESLSIAHTSLPLISLRITQR